MAAVRVPPSACRTSQSSVMVRSPSARRSATARSARPMRRWISCVRPLCLPRAASRAVRVCVERGSMPYSAVIQPWPLPRRNGGTESSTLAVHSTCVSPKATITDPSACLAWRRSKLTCRSWSASRPEVRSIASVSQPAQRRGGGVVAAGAAALHRALAERLEFAGELTRAAELIGDVTVLERPPQAVGADQQYVLRAQRAAAAERHVRQDGIAAQAALDEIAHGMIVGLLGIDHALAQQQLHVAVIAAARQELSLAQVIDAAVADVRPPGGVLLYQAHRAGGARPLLERQLRAEFDHLLVGAADGQVQEAERIEERLRRGGERFHDRLLGHLRGARTVRVSAHAVDHQQQRCVLADRGVHPVLILVAPAQQADFRVFDSQAEVHASVRLVSALYHL